MKPHSGKIVLSWVLLLSWVLFIYLTLSTVPEWRDVLVKKYGEQVFTTITFAGAAVALAIILGMMIFLYRQNRIVPYIALAVSLGFLAYVMLHWITLPVEQIHFIEYGLVGFLAYNALRHHQKGFGLVLAAILLTFFFGMVDEYIQGVLESRVGEQRDMYWNGLAGIIALAIVSFSMRPGILRQGFGRSSFRFCLVIVGGCLIVQGIFNTRISQFGYFIEDPGLNVTFKSRILPADLLTYDIELDHFKENIAPLIGKERMAKLLPQVHNLIHEEALVHCFRRGYHFRKGNIRTVYSEDLIIDKYYKNFVTGTHLDWPRQLSDAMRPVVGKRFEVLYHSIVANHLITGYRAWQMWTVIALLEALIALLLYLSFRRPLSG